MSLMSVLRWDTYREHLWRSPALICSLLSYWQFALACFQSDLSSYHFRQNETIGFGPTCLDQFDPLTGLRPTFRNTCTFWSQHHTQKGQVQSEHSCGDAPFTFQEARLQKDHFAIGVRIVWKQVWNNVWFVTVFGNGTSDSCAYWCPGKDLWSSKLLAFGDASYLSRKLILSSSILISSAIHHVVTLIFFQFLANNTAAILYLTDSENYGRDSVASQYFMQLAQYVKLPMISWNADNSAFEMGSLQLQLAPTLKQQASAMLTILERYSWNTFSIITGQIAGHRNFEIVSKILYFIG